MPRLKSPKKSELNPQLSSMITDSVISVYEIDFDGDYKNDYLVTVTNGELTDPYAYELWINSKFEIVKRVPKYICDFDYTWFVNLDADRVPEIICAWGFSDGIDYSIIDQNLTTGKDSLLLRFHPILIDRSKSIDIYYWGYPWEIRDMFVEWYQDTTILWCSFDHYIERDGEIDIPEWQKFLPAIVFIGDSIDYEPINSEIDTTEWKTFQEILRNAR
jgi:hypothetical protein